MLTNSSARTAEALNAAYAVKRGAAISVGNRKISAVVTELLNDRVRLEEMRRCAKKISRPFAAKEIVAQMSRHVDKLRALKRCP